MHCLLNFLMFFFSQSDEASERGSHYFQKVPTKRDKLPTMNVHNVLNSIILSINEQNKLSLKFKLPLESYRPKSPNVSFCKHHYNQFARTTTFITLPNHYATETKSMLCTNMKQKKNDAHQFSTFQIFIMCFKIKSNISKKHFLFINDVERILC